MKIVLFDALSISQKLGIVTEWKRVIDGDFLKFNVDRAGKLCIGQREYNASNDCIYVPQYHVLMGEPQKIYFIDPDGNKYYCGIIKRTGSRLMEICNDVEACIITCCAALDAQQAQLKTITENIQKLKNEYGITFN